MSISCKWQCILQKLKSYRSTNPWKIVPKFKKKNICANPSTAIWGKEEKMNCFKTPSYKNEVQGIALKPQTARTRSKWWKYLPGWFKGAAKQIRTLWLTAMLWPRTLCGPTATSEACLTCPPSLRLNLNQIAVFVCRDLFPSMLQIKQQVVESPSLMFLQTGWRDTGMNACNADSGRIYGKAHV